MTAIRPTSLPRFRGRRRRALTLVELVVSMTIMGLLMGGMGSAIIIASNAIPDGASLADRTARGGDILDRITEELMYAVSVTEKSGTTIAFTVTDRGHNAAGNETIRFAWSATPGDPVTLEYNGSAPIALADDIHSFALAYTYKSGTPQTPSDPEGAEEMLLFQDGSNSGTASDFDVANNKRIAGYFTPVLPADTVSWRITRVSFIGSPAKNANGTLAVGVTGATGNGKPSNNPIEEVLVAESSLVAGQWHEVTFANAGGLDPTEGYHITFTNAGAGGPGSIRTGIGSTGSPESSTFIDDGGGTWSEDATVDVWLQVWGRVTAPNAMPPPSSDALLSSVRIQIQVGDNTLSQVQSEVRTVNQPDVSGL